MKLRIVTLSILLAGGLFSLMLQAQEPQILIPGGPKETQDFELVNDSNATIFYSVGEAVDPRLHAVNFPLKRLEPDARISGKRALAPNQRTMFQIIATPVTPSSDLKHVSLFQIVPNKKDTFVSIVRAKITGNLNLQPQVPIEPSLLDRLLGRARAVSKTGRDLTNNVNQNDILSTIIPYTHITRYTPPVFTPEVTPEARTKLEVQSILLKLPNIDNELKVIITRILDPRSTVYDILGLDQRTATAEDVANAHQALILALDDLNIPEAQELIKRVNNLVNQYYQQIPEPRPAEPVQPAQEKAISDQIRSGGTLREKTGFQGPEEEIVEHTFKVIDVLTKSGIKDSQKLIEILKTALNDYLEAQEQAEQPRQIVVPPIPPAPIPAVSPQERELKDIIQRLNTNRPFLEIIGLGSKPDASVQEIKDAFQRTKDLIYSSTLSIEEKTRLFKRLTQAIEQYQPRPSVEQYVRPVLPEAAPLTDQEVELISEVGTPYQLLRAIRTIYQIQEEPNEDNIAEYMTNLRDFKERFGATTFANPAVKQRVSSLLDRATTVLNELKKKLNPY